MEIYKQKFRSPAFSVNAEISEATGLQTGTVVCCILNYKGEDELCELFAPEQVAHLPIFAGR